ncbi:MAG: ComF family protein [Caldilineaceae bacterium]|nr:ComF family protein [Caldilineaceae bacterium]
MLPISGPICAHCGRPQPRDVGICFACQSGGREVFHLVRPATLYTHPLRSAIHGLKYAGQPELAELLARYLVAVAQQPLWQDVLPRIDWMLPVPLHPQRLAERGYNQSGLLAASAAKRLGLAYTDSLLLRSRQTRSQVGLSASERQQNVADAFVAGAGVADKCVLLVDDVLTTGATLTACAQALRLAGAVAVYGLVLSTPAPTTDGVLGDAPPS